MPFDFTGKKILVTGAGRGIGRELTRAIVNAGGEVYALGRTKENIVSLSRELDKVHPIVVDLKDWDRTKEELDKVEALDGVVNNAAELETWVAALDVKEDILKNAMNVNVMAPINVIQATAKKMIAAGKRGSIVNVSSISGVNAIESQIEYTTSKAALDMVTKQFALELGPHGIRVNSVNPTGVLTDFVKDYFMKNPTMENKFNSLTPLGRMAEVSEVVDPILYLLSDHSNMVTGTTHIIDGGILSHIPV